YRTKAKNIQKLACKLIDDFNGEVPKTRAELESLAGVGRKTANVVLSVAIDIPAIAVDTHVERVAKRLAFCRWKDNTRQVEETLMKKIPKEEWSVTHHPLIFLDVITAQQEIQNVQHVSLWIYVEKVKKL